MKPALKYAPGAGLLLAVALLTSDCSTRPPASEQSVNRPAARPINSIRVGEFQCEHKVTGEAARNVFIEMLARYGDVKVVREGDADVVIEGTVTYAQAGSSSGGAGGNSHLVLGGSEATVGDYVSGVTSLALRNGEIFASASWGQVIRKGNELLPPETVARNAANRLLKQLYHEGLKER